MNDLNLFFKEILKLNFNNFEVSVNNRDDLKQCSEFTVPNNYEAIHIVTDLSHFLCPRGGMLRSSKSGLLCARQTLPLNGD